MRAIAIIMELTIRAGILLLKGLAILAGIAIVIMGIANPQIAAGVIVFIAIGFLCWTPVREWLKPKKK